MTFKRLVLLPAICLAGCATMPQNIKPAFVAQSSYDSLNCERLKSTREEIDSHLLGLSVEQEHAHHMGVVWVTLGTVVTWPAYFGLIGAKKHDHKDEIARLKGEREAISDSVGARCGAQR